MHRRFPRHSLAATALAAALLAHAPAHAADKPIPVAVDSSFNAAELAGKAFTIADTQALKGMARVAVPVFVTADNVSTHTSSFGAAGRVSSSAYDKLLGVGEPEFQAITNALHADFLARLKASGLELVADGQLQAAPSFRKLVAGGKVAPIRSDNNVVLAPPGLGVYGFARGSAKTSGQVLPSIDGVMVGVQRGPSRSTLTMTQTLTLDPAAFADVREKATTAGDVAGAVLVARLKAER
jgi:hypothetical protein